MSELKTIIINGMKYTVADADSVSMGPNGNWWIDGKDTGISISVGATTTEGGVIFGDLKTNKAENVFAAAFGYMSKASGKSSLSTGTMTYASGAEYARDGSGQYYVIDENSTILKDCEVLNAGHIIVGPNGLGPDYIQTSDGGFVSKTDTRGNEAIGAGSMSSGMGAIAFARASKSLGYRTQTGYPTDPKYLSERPELHVLTENLQFTADTETGTTANQFNTAVVNPWPLYTDLGVPYINKMAVQINDYSCGISGSAKAYLRFVFANKCCTDFPSTDVELSGSTDVPLSLDFVIQVPEGATQCSIYVVHTGTGSASGEIFDLTVTKFPLDNLNQAAFAIGADTAALGKHSFAGGLRTIARADNSFAFGYNDPGAAVPTWTEANGSFSLAFGLNCHTNALGSMAFGDSNFSNAAYTMTLGQQNSANKALSLAFGKLNETQALHATAIGLQNMASGKASTAIGEGNTSENSYAVSLGWKNHSYGIGSFAAGQECIAGKKEWSDDKQNYVFSGTGATAFGVGNEANFYGAFAYGQGNVASNYNTIAGGSLSQAKHANSTAIGRGTRTSRAAQIVVGQWNADNSGALFIIGNGSRNETTLVESRSTAFAVKSTGDVLVGSKTVHSGADYAEFFEWVDGNINNEDRIGLLVTLEGDCIRFAQPGDEVLGIVSGTAAVLGDSAALHWKDKYLTDEFGRVLYDMVEEFVDGETDLETGITPKVPVGLVPQPRLNPAYDPESVYIPREERKEWDQIGMMGKLYVRDDGTCSVGDYGCPGSDGVLTKSINPTNIRVMKRTSDNIVLVLLK